MTCPLCCAEKDCLHQRNRSEMGGVWEDIVEFGYPSFPAYTFDEGMAAHYRKEAVEGRENNRM